MPINNDNQDFITNLGQPIPYQKELKQKQVLIEKLYKKQSVLPIIVAPLNLHYRHKVVLSAINQKVTKQHYKIKLGLYQEGTKNIIPNLNHVFHDKQINDALTKIEKILQGFKLQAYHAKSGQGIIKHVMIRKSFANQDLMVVIVTMGNMIPNAKLLVKQIVTQIPQVKTIIQNIHHKDTSIVILDEEKLLYGPGYIIDKIDDLSFKITAKSFYQVNPKAMFKLYEAALKMAKITKDSVVLDTFCGIGTITLLAAKQAQKVIGVDINPTSIKLAKENARLNNITNATFFIDDCLKPSARIVEPIDVLIMDPTRVGASIEFMDFVLQIKPKKVLYISCDPNTQFRDIQRLLPTYNITTIQPVDMFPGTTHLENIILLTKK